MSTPLGDRTDEVRRILADRPGLRYALLFGSVARGEEHARSDVDIAVRGVEGADRLDLEADLEACLERPIQVVELGSAPPALRYRVFRDGWILFERDRTARVVDQTRAVMDYLDFRPWEERLVRGALRTGRRGGS